MGDGGAEGSSAIGDGGQAAISLMPDIDGLGSGSLLDSFLSLKILYCNKLVTFHTNNTEKANKHKE